MCICFYENFIDFSHIYAPLAVTGLTEDMYEDGYSAIVNTDISRVVIDQMTDRNRDKSSLVCKPCACGV